MSKRYLALLFSPRSPTAFLTRVVIIVVTFAIFSFALGLMPLPRMTAPRTTKKPYIPPPNPDFPEDKPVVVSKFEIRAANASVKSTCPFPKLDLHDPAIMKFYVKHQRVACDVEKNWVTLHGGVFALTDSALGNHTNIKCDLYPIVKESDFKTHELPPLTNVTNGTRITNDFYRVSCTADGGAKYHNYHAGIRYDEQIQNRKDPPKTAGLDLDVIMIGLDSTSRLAWRRHLPLTRDYFVNVLNGIEMEGYNILGDGTPAAIMPILIGHREEELHEARRGYEGAKPVDDFPWIWKEFKEAGYATAWGEDDAHLGTFQYRLLGFADQPTDHYYRYFSLAIEPHYKDFKQYCLGSRPRHAVLQDYMREMYFMYPNRRKWIFSFQSELSHSDNNLLSKMDDDFMEHIRRLHKEKHLDNAILIMMADHGARFSKVRATAQGKQEERLPYFGIRFPEWFSEKYPEIVQNVRKNSKRLTTPFDVHETLHEVLKFTGAGAANISNRGVSLFKEIPEERDCNWAHIDPHWCACMDWVKMNPDDPTLKKVTKVIVETFNNYTQPFRKDCAVLKVQEVKSAAAMKVKDAVLKFKDTSDGGRGRFGKMDDTTKESTVLYQVILSTTPGDGLFEATVTHSLQQDSWTLEKKDISRTNKYGNASHCVEKREPFLRPFCYCKDLINS